MARLLGPVRADDWLVLDMTGHGATGMRGLATGPVLSKDGTQVATIAQVSSSS